MGRKVKFTDRTTVTANCDRAIAVSLTALVRALGYPYGKQGASFGLFLADIAAGKLIVVKAENLKTID